MANSMVWSSGYSFDDMTDNYHLELLIARIDACSNVVLS